MYPKMTEENYVSFGDFYESIVNPPSTDSSMPAQEFVEETYSYFRKKVGKISGY